MIYNSKMSSSNFTWESKTFNQSAVKVCMSADGNLAMSNKQGIRLWKTRSNRPDVTDAKLIIEDDGVLVIYNGEEKLWASGL